MGFDLVIDASAIVSIAEREHGYERLVTVLKQAKYPCMGAPTALEASMVLHGRMSGDARMAVKRILDDVDAVVLAFEEHHYWVAQDAFIRFGKGNHRASLNFGDCMTYAIARDVGAPILCTGNDFAQTDVRIA